MNIAKQKIALITGITGQDGSYLLGWTPTIHLPNGLNLAYAYFLNQISDQSR